MQVPRHSALVRITHWLTVIAFAALLVTGAELVISHPRFYWGETGNVNMKPLFSLPLPTSRDTIDNGYGSKMPDQNGWSRYLHFQSAWLLVLTGAIYGIASLLNGHFRRDLVPESGQRNLGSHLRRLVQYLQRTPPAADESATYNVLQRTTYLGVIFVLFPLVIWTGLALSPSFNAAYPFFVDVLGGRQSARTLHFFVSWALFFFLVIHVVMIAVSGFWSRTRAMITGRAAATAAATEERP